MSLRILSNLVQTCVVVRGSETWLSVICATRQHLYSSRVSFLKSTKDWCTNRIQKSGVSSYFCIASTEVSVSIIDRETAKITNSSPIIVTHSEHIHEVTIQTRSFWQYQQTDACILSPTWMKIFYCCFTSCHGEKETCLCDCSLADAGLLQQRYAQISEFLDDRGKKRIFYQLNV